MVGSAYNRPVHYFRAHDVVTIPLVESLFVTSSATDLVPDVLPYSYYRVAFPYLAGVGYSVTFNDSPVRGRLFDRRFTGSVHNVR